MGKVIYNQAGYCGSSMSGRAREAYEDGWRQGSSVWVALAPPSRGRVTVARAYDFGGCVEWLAEPRRVLPVESGLLRVKRGDAADSHAFPCGAVAVRGDLPGTAARGFVPDSADVYSPEPIPS